MLLVCTRVHSHRLPEVVGLHGTQNKDIAFYECLAQAFLLFLRAPFLGTCCMPLVLRHLSDNAPTQGAANKLFSMVSPLKHGVRLLATLSARTGVTLELGHIPGALNVWADGLSRARDHKHIVELFDYAKKLKADVEDLSSFSSLSSWYPKGAQWPASAKSAAARLQAG